MAFQVVPLTTAPNQRFRITLSVDGGQVTLQLGFYYSAMCGFWIMNIADQNGNPLVSSIPLITGSFPGGNLLRAQGYLAIGSAYIINQSGLTDYPDDTNLGSDFILLWGDTCA